MALQSKSKKMTKMSASKLKKKALGPSPLTFKKICRFFINKKTFTYPFVALAAGAMVYFLFGFSFWQFTIFTLLQLYALRYIDNCFDQEYDIEHHKEMFYHKDNVVMAWIFNIAFVVFNVACFQWQGLVSILFVLYMISFQFVWEYLETLMSCLMVLYFVWIYGYAPDWKLLIVMIVCLIFSNIYAFYKQRLRK